MNPHIWWAHADKNPALSKNWSQGEKPDLAIYERAAGLDELMVALVPTKYAGDDDEQSQLIHLIGQL